jgi:hypothetical protein
VSQGSRLSIAGGHARHAALDTVIVVGGVRVKTGQVSQGSRLSIAGGHARHAALDTVIVVGGVRVKTGQVSQGSRLSTAGGHARHAALDTVIVVGGVRVKTGQVSQGSRLSAALGVPTAGVPGWACGHARQPSQTPSRGGSRAQRLRFPLLSLVAHPDCQYHDVPTACQVSHMVPLNAYTDTVVVVTSTAQVTSRPLNGAHTLPPSPHARSVLV